MTSEEIIAQYPEIEKIWCMAQENPENKNLAIISEFLFKLTNDLLENGTLSNPVIEDAITV